MSRFKVRRHATALAFALLAALWATPHADAYGDGRPRDEWFFGRDAWEHGAQLNLRFLGHLGRAVVATVPDGGFAIEAQYGLWFHHFIEGHVQVFHSLGLDLPFRGFGAGARVNLLEFSKANALDFARENTAGLRCVETKRGLFAWMLHSLLVYGAVDYNRYWFSQPDTDVFYTPDQGALQWGGGAQWGPNIRVPGVSRIYLDTSILFTRVTGAFFGIPYVGIGANF